jgi:hypothetical protein
LDGPGKSRWRGWPEWHCGWNDDTSTGNFLSWMIGCSPTLACRERSLKTCGGLRCISRRGATVDDASLRAVVRRLPAGRDRRVDANVSSRAWHTLGIAARDDRFIILFDGRELFGATDGTLSAADRVGLWKKANRVTWFEGINIKSLD